MASSLKSFNVSAVISIYKASESNVMTNHTKGQVPHPYHSKIFCKDVSYRLLPFSNENKLSSDHNHWCRKRHSDVKVISDLHAIIVAGLSEKPNFTLSPFIYF